MEERRPSQKQISDLYSGTADYPKRAHYFRRLKVGLILFAVVFSIAMAVGYSFWFQQTAFTPGPVSQSHAGFATNCQACHLEMEKVPSKMGSLVFGGKSDEATHRSAIALMDTACIQCHPTMKLHLPQAANLAAVATMNRNKPPVSSQLTAVHATGCALCHREHVDKGRMALPSQKSCAACHNNATELAKAGSVMSIKNSAKPVGASGENRDLGDGVIRFLMPERTFGTLPTFASYADGHPGFPWEKPGVKDPAVLQFNHLRHLSADFPKVDGHALDCRDCHKPGADGVFMQPIKYDLHCARCHTLQLQPGVVIPHGDPKKVRYFLANLDVSFRSALKDNKGTTNAADLDNQVKEAVNATKTRFTGELENLERIVFTVGDPPIRKNASVGRTDSSQILTACSKCHEVKLGDTINVPQVTPPNMAQRWIEHGPFTHLPHQHINCTDCHGMARRSSATSDILLPMQLTCIECHRPPAETARNLKFEPPKTPEGQAAAQRTTGGVGWDCTNCHRFHAAPGAQTMVDALLTRPKMQWERWQE